MPKYWGKQIFTHGSFPEVGQKQTPPRVTHAKTPGPTYKLKLNGKGGTI